MYLRDVGYESNTADLVWMVKMYKIVLNVPI
jgi:hypothetical protein